MVTAISPITFQYSHTIGRQEVRSGNGFFMPVAITRDPENRLYVLSRGSETPAFFPCKRVTVFTVDEEFIEDYGQKIPPEEADPATCPNGSFMWPTSVALDSEGNTYVSDEWLHRVSVYKPGQGWTDMWGTLGSGDGEINKPSGLAFDKDDNLYLVDSYNHRVQVFTRDGKFQFSWGSHGDGPGQFSYPWGIEIDRNGDVYVADWRNDRIQKFAPDGTFLMQFGSHGFRRRRVRPPHRRCRRQGWHHLRHRLQERPSPDLRRRRQLHHQAPRRGHPVQVGPRARPHRPHHGQGPLASNDLGEREAAFQGPIAVEVDDEGRVFVVEVARQRLQVFQKQSAVYQGGLL